MRSLFVPRRIFIGLISGVLVAYSLHGTQTSVQLSCDQIPNPLGLVLFFMVATVMTCSNISSVIGTSTRCVSLPSAFDRPDLDNIVDIRGGSYMTEMFWWQAAALFWVCVCFFRVGAMTKNIVMTRNTWLEIAQAALIVVAVFALLTEGRGCRSIGGSTLDTPACVDDGGGC